MRALILGLKGYRVLPTGSWTLLWLQFLTSASQFMAVPVLALYLAEHLAFTAPVLATVMTMHFVASRAISLVTGPVADTFGFRLTASAGLVLRGAGMAGFAFFTDWMLLSVAALTHGLGTAAYESAVFGAFSQYKPKVTVRLFVLNSQALNLGVVVGPILGAGLLIFDARHVFMMTGLCFALLALVPMTCPLPTSRARPSRSIGTHLTVALFDARSVIFAIVCLPWWFLFSQIFVVLPLHAVHITGIDASANLVFLVNGVTGVSFVAVSLMVFEEVSALRVLLACYGILVPAYLLLLGLGGIQWFLGFVVLYTLVETLILPAIRTIVAAFSPPGHEGAYQGLQSLSWAVGGALGYFSGSWLLLNAPVTTMWLVFASAAAVGLGMSAIYAVFCRYLQFSLVE